MEDDSDEADDIPTIKVGGEEYEITDVTHEIIAKYSTFQFLLFLVFNLPCLQDDS